jgi:hypothetical protein
LTLIEENYLANIEKMYTDLIPFAANGNADAQTYMTELAAFNQTIQAYFDDIFTFIDTAPAFTLFFKTLLCKSPYGISPFFKKGPSEACKSAILSFFFISHYRLCFFWLD